MRAVRLDRRNADRQQIGHVLVAIAFRHPLEHFALPLRQRFVAIDDPFFRQVAQVIVEHDLRGGRAEKRFSGRDRRDAANKIRVGGILEQVPARAGLERRRDERLLSVHAQDEHTGLRQPANNLARCLDAAQQRHGYVEDDDVGLQCEGKTYRFASVRRLAHNFPAFLRFENLAQALPHNRVIVAEENSQICHPYHPASTAALASSAGAPASVARRTGSSTIIRVPRFGELSSATVPLRCDARSRMPIRPSPRRSADRGTSGSKPMPLSSMTMRSTSDWRARKTWHSVALACFATLLRAS